MSDEPVATTASPRRGTLVMAASIDADRALAARRRSAAPARLRTRPS